MAAALHPNDANILYNVACTHGIPAGREEALEMLRRCFSVGYANFDWPRQDPDLKTLHDDPDFKKLIPASNP